MRVSVSLFMLFISHISYGYTTPSCDELNRLYTEKYINDFTPFWELDEAEKNRLHKIFNPLMDGDKFKCPTSSTSKEEIENGQYAYYVATRNFNILDTVKVLEANGKQGFDYYDYVTSGLGLDEQGDIIGGVWIRATSDDSTDFTASPTGEGIGDISLPKIFFKLEEFGFVFAAALVHERRHFDDDYHAHQICNGGFYKGKPGCDEYTSDWKNGGSYHYDLMYYFDLATKGQGLSNSTRRNLKRQVELTLKNNFNYISNIEIQRILNQIPD